MKTNKYGMPLDRNGYAPSIIEGDGTRCFSCASRSEKLDRHEVFGGAYRTKSKNLGLWVSLCHIKCHLDGIHRFQNQSLTLKKYAQQIAMMRYEWTEDDFRREFGRSYL